MQELRDRLQFRQSEETEAKKLRKAKELPSSQEARI